MAIKNKLKNILGDLQNKDFQNLDEQVEYFLTLLLQKQLVIREIVQCQCSLIKGTSTIYQSFDQDQVFEKLSYLLQVCNEGEKVGVFEDIYALLRALLMILGDTTSPKIKNKNPNLFDLNLTSSEQDLSLLRQKWESIAESHKHSTMQKRIASIVIRLAYVARFHDKAVVQKLATILLEIPESITDEDILQELEMICNLSEEMQETSVELKQDCFAKILEELQNTLNIGTKEIKQLNEIREQIVAQSGDLIEQQDGLKFLNVANKFYEKITSLNQTLHKKEMYIKDLNDQLHRLTTMLKQMEEKTKTDSLTDVYNRCYLEELLNYCEAQFVNYQENYAILFFDIDEFKGINDYYGHLVGDELLIQFVRILKQNSRSSDVIGRYGGDEFLIIMPKTSICIAKDVAIRICKAVSKEDFICQNKHIGVTTSIGVVDRQGFENKDEMIRRADFLLYQAKNDGRNRVRWE